MATRKDPGGGKKPPRKPVTSVAKPKAKVTVSRGSKTAKQMGDMNQRELYNAYRGQNKNQRPLKYGEAVGKVGTKEAATANMGIERRILRERKDSQRAGGSKNLGPMEVKSKAKGVANKPKGTLKKKSSLSKVEPKAGPRKFRTTQTKSPEGKANIARISAKKTGDQNMRENYNASKDSKYPRTKQLSSYKKDGGASRNFMRRGGNGK